MPNHLKKIIIIVNPAAGQETPFLKDLNAALNKAKITWDMWLTKIDEDAESLARKAVAENPDAIVVYGGDGTVLAVAAVTYQTTIPLIILPGGTANILAKELGVPLEFKAALEIFHRQPIAKKIDVALFNERPMFLRVEIGVIAEMVDDVGSKEKLGILAYPLAAIKKFMKAKTINYSIEIDGKKRHVKGVAMMIANVGNIGLPGVSLQSNVDPDDKKLDIFVLQSSDVSSLISVGTSALVGTNKPPVLKHWTGKAVKVTMKPKQKVVCDDQVVNQTHLSITLQRQTLKLLV